jgi:hypothetical protein
MHVEAPFPLATVVRGLLLASLVIPLLGVSGAAALIRFAGQQTTGPGAKSWFAEVSAVFSFAVPLVMVGIALVGHAFRERCAAFAFAAGLLVNLTLIAGYALDHVNPEGLLPLEDWVRLGQLGAACAALWAIAWLGSRPWVATWRSDSGGALSQPLMSVQVGMAIAYMASLLLVALAVLILAPAVSDHTTVQAAYRRAPAWLIEVGSPLGWLALALVIVAAYLRDFPVRKGIPSQAIGVAVLAGLGVLACTLEGLGAGWGYRALMVGCGGWALAVSLGAWGIAKRLPLGQEPEAPDAIASLWVRITGFLVLFMGLKAAVWHNDHLWAAAAIALASMAGAALAVWHRREDWAFVAGLGVNLAASLVVWHLHRREPVEDWWVVLIQANVIASAMGTMLWLSVREWLFPPADLARPPGPLLSVQVALGFLGNALLLLFPLGHLVLQPGDLPRHLADVGQTGGWAALILAMAAAVWYLQQNPAPIGTHLVGGMALALGVLLACTASQWDTGNWLAFHVLTAAWLLAGAAMLGFGWTIVKEQAGVSAPEAAADHEGAAPTPVVHFPTRPVQAWVAAMGALVVLLAIRGAWDDPQRPYWSGVATLGVSGLAGLLAFWSQRPFGVYVSGLLINLAGILAWIAWGPNTLASFASTNVLCLGIASVCWSVLELPLAGRVSLPDRRTGYLPFAHAAALSALCILAVLVLFAVVSDVSGAGLYLSDRLAWTAFAAVALALIVLVWDPQADLALPGLYTGTLLGLALNLHGRQLAPAAWGWNLTWMLGSFVLLATLVGWMAPRLGTLWKALHLPARSSPWPASWFPGIQAIVGAVVLGLSLCVCLDFTTTSARLGGVLGLAFLVPAGVLLAGRAHDRWASAWRLATLALGALVLVEGGWALLPADAEAPWLHRSVIGMVVLGAVAFAYRLGLPGIIGAPEWHASARQVGRVVGILAAGLLALVFVEEALLYDLSSKTTPLSIPGIVAVGLGLVVLMVLSIFFAVRPEYDPFQLSAGRRHLYVYGCEILLVLLFVHLRLNVPGLFGAFAAKYWAMIVMAICFVGVGLSEFFSRKNLPVLAEPLQRTGLFLPLLPLLAFWFQPPLEIRAFAQEHAPAMEPFLRSVKRPAGGFSYYAFLWFASALLYTIVAVTKRSFWFALLAALAVNFGLWSMLYHYGWQFVIHPQLWLIPLALILLVSEYVNRDRLSRGQGLSLRYLALGLLYLSSTADMFITGVGNSVILPLVLAVLSILGVLAGIVLRVRAFLFLGVSFLFLVIFSMIWHAAVDRTQTWVWWASGIVLGVGIVALFAVFEKRRNDVLRLIDEIKKWH